MKEKKHHQACSRDRYPKLAYAKIIPVNRVNGWLQAIFSGYNILVAMRDLSG